MYWIGVKYPDWFVAICEELVGHSVQWKDKRWEIEREYNHYDLCTVYKVEKKGTRKKETFKEEIPFVLENKVKSIPYKEQLDGYANKAEEPIGLERDWVLLSLSTDFPDKKTIEEGKIWKVKNYNDLYTAIVQNKDKHIHNQYDLFLIEDYCLFIKYMHKLVETWDIKKEDKFHSKEDMKKLYKDLRIGDLYEKTRYNQAFYLLQNELKEKLNLSQDDIKKRLTLKR